VTVVAEGEGEAPDRTVHTMVVDHPFFFAICDDASGAILFTGTVLAP
jgi:serine protease inhibitor